jgi:hypothetical protein
LVVNFNASASSDPDAGDTIASYTFDFGDGSAPVTQASATISHTYQSNGHFHATVSVSDNHGLVSSNVAGVEIEVELPLDDVVSSKQHGAITPDFTVDLLKTDGTNDIECRAPGPENSYKIIYTFGSASEFTTTGPASSVTLDGAGTYISAHGPGPGTNQYTITLLSSVPNAQRHLITLNGVPIHNNNVNGNATLNNVLARFDLLVADVNGSGRVDSNDVFSVRQQSLQTLTPSNFRNDVDASGRIDSNDVFKARQQNLTGLP